MPHDDKIDKILETVTSLKVDVASIKAETRAQTKIIGATRIDVKEVKKEQKVHDDKDDLRFEERATAHGKHNDEIQELKTSMKWMKGIGSFIVTVVGAIFYTVFGWKMK